SPTQDPSTHPLKAAPPRRQRCRPVPVAAHRPSEPADATLAPPTRRAARRRQTTTLQARATTQVLLAGKVARGARAPTRDSPARAAVRRQAVRPRSRAASAEWTVAARPLASRAQAAR